LSNLPQIISDAVTRPSSPLAKHEESASKPKEILTFPPLKPRGPGIDAFKPAFPGAEPSTQMINGVIFSRDHIRRIVQLWNQNKTEWTISRYLDDEYGLWVSGNTVHEVLKAEGVLEPVKKMVPATESQEAHEEEVVPDYVEHLMFKTKVVEGFVISEDMERRMVALFDKGKETVGAIQMSMVDEYGAGVPKETVESVLTEAGRKFKKDFD
jgi:hypothetical protein